MVDTLTTVLVIISVIFSSAIVWLFMSQHMARVLEITRLENEKKIAENNAREVERKDVEDERNIAMTNSFKLIAQQAFEDVKSKAEREKKEEFSKIIYAIY